MHRILTNALCAFMLLATIASCTKQAPAGSTGLAGASGPTGAPGPTGPAGQSGNDNIIYSAWTTGFSGTYGDWAVPALTQGTLDSSAVLVYLKAEVIVPLPLYNIYRDSELWIVDNFAVGHIVLNGSPGIDLSYDTFRYVIIPPGVVTTDISRSYEKMMANLGIAP